MTKVLLAALALSAALPARGDEFEFRFQSRFLDQAPAPGTQESSLDKPALRLITISAMLTVVVGLIVWDVFLAAKGADTESQIITGFAWKYSSLPYILGILIGHWLFTHEQPWNMNVWPYALASIGLVVAWDLIKPPEKSWTKYPGLWFAVGVPVGAFLWGQRHSPAG